MSYIQPNSIIQLFKGINLDNRYMHTIYFASVSAQNTYFASKVFRSFQNVSYVRYTANRVKLKCDATEIMDCTYLRFQNDRSVDMWYYAFINAVEYVNENTAIVTFEIDVMQTWFIQKGSIQPCLVRREHVTSDNIEGNLEPEPVGGEHWEGDALTYTSDYVDLFANYVYVVSTTGEPNETGSFVPHTGYKIMPMSNNNMLIGAKQYIFADNASALKDQLNQIMGGNWDEQERKEDVIDMFAFPAYFANSDVAANTHQLTIAHPTTLDGYTPKNNKLYTYPYSYLMATTMNGDSANYQWENFFDVYPLTSFNVNFTAYGNPIGGGMIHCYPDNYQSIANNIDAGIVIDNFPKVPYSYDAYQAWVASGGQTRYNDLKQLTTLRGIGRGINAGTNLETGIIGGLLNTSVGAAQTAVGFKGGDPSSVYQGINTGLQGVGQTMNAVGNFMQEVAAMKEAQNKVKYTFNDAMYTPNQVVSSASPTLTCAERKINFYFFNMHLKLEELKRCDNFFSMYGYASNRVKVPNLTGRQYWNFVQTENAVIAGNMPASSKEAIGRIFDGGITFWHNGDQIGNYNQSISYTTINNPITV